MAFKLLVIGLIQMAVASQAATLQDLMVADDTMSLGSYIRPARSPAPEDYHKSYENEGDGEIGYSRKKTGGGKKGYQHFDSYHKKAGDNFEFQKQDSFGHDDDGHAGAHSHQNEKKVEAYREPESDEEEREPERDEEEREHQENPKKKDHEKLREGPSNEEVDVAGYDKADYSLPEKYTYGTGEEYNFK
ncbi:unnamed protein product [Pieris macdunnoughi]|uniref:Uncharacterized protein n=1 Tax=Pieris macdunnoughi TaxID=345717 RepID=A0A821XRF2_9NEOP|nr:unnamed protein product [Pieris macdunnoughi]